MFSPYHIDVVFETTFTPSSLEGPVGLPGLAFATTRLTADASQEISILPLHDTVWWVRMIRAKIPKASLFPGLFKGKSGSKASTDSSSLEQEVWRAVSKYGLPDIDGNPGEHGVIFAEFDFASGLWSGGDWCGTRTSGRIEVALFYHVNETVTELLPLR